MSARRFLVVVVLWGLVSSPAPAVDKRWQGGASGTWDEFLSWSPLGAPQVGDDVIITDLPLLGADAETFLDTDYTINSLTLKHGGDADTNGHLLEVNGEIRVGGTDASATTTPRLTVSQHAAGAGTTALEMEDLNVFTDGEVILDGGRIVSSVSGSDFGSVVICSNGSFSGYGVVRFQDSLDTLTTQFCNQGTLSTMRPAGAPDTTRFVLAFESGDPQDARIVFGAVSTAMVSLASMTTLDVDTAFGDQALRGEMDLSAGSVFDTSDSSTANNNLIVIDDGRLTVIAATSLPGVPSTATLRGPHLQLNAETEANINSGTLILENGLTADATSTINIGTNAGLQIDDVSTIDGDLNITGTGASLVVNADLEINDAVFDWDGGEDAVTTVNEGGHLTIVADDVTPGVSDDTFDGTINLSGGDLTVAIVPGWTLAGTLNFAGGQFFNSLGLLTIEGNVNVTGGSSLLVVDSVFASGSNTTIQGTSDVLDTKKDTRIEAGAVFSGNGLLETNGNSSLTLADGASVQVSTRNSDEWHIEDGAGQATVLTYNQRSSADLFVELGGATPTAYDRLDVLDTAVIDGDVNVSLINGFTPAEGQSFTILSAAVLVGEFNNGPETLPSLPGGLFWDIEYNSSQVILHVLAPGLPGDFNADGTVNAADYVVWRDNLGDPNEDALNGNGNGTGGVTQADYVLWQVNFGNTLATAVGAVAPSETPTPEPSALVLIAVSAIYGIWRYPRLARSLTKS